MIFVYVTYPNKVEAKRAAKAVISQKLCACVNFFPIEAIYAWKGKIHEGKEIGVIFKTVKNKENQLKRELKKMHSYDVCCIAPISVSGADNDFTNWLKREVR